MLFKRFLLVLILTCLTQTILADQLAYISKEQAEETVKKLASQKKLILFCGCCENDTPQEIKVLKIYSRHTGYQDFYKVVIEYQTPGNNTVQKEAVDLAYVWLKKKKKHITVAKLMNFEHDPCNTPKFKL